MKIRPASYQEVVARFGPVVGNKVSFLPSAEHWVAEVKDTVVGCCAIWRRGQSTWILKSLWVDPPYRRQGIGRAMFDYRCSILRSRGVRLARGNFTKYSLPLALGHGGKVIAVNGYSSTVEFAP